MADINANIGVNIDASQALAELKNLQRQISQFHTSIARSSATAAAAQRNLQTDFLNAINATGKFAAEMRTIKTASESFTNSLEKNKFSLGEYFKYAGGASKTFGRLFRSEFDTINKVAEDRVKKLQTQFIKMGRDANGALKAIAITPLALDMDNLQTKTMIAAQRQQLFNQLIAQGTTNLINFGKNTQWAGRQLMVGFTVPLTIFGSKATQVFLDVEQQALRFKRVYGDLFTSQAETQANLDAIRGLAAEYTKYGVALKDTMALAADAAAAGFTGAKLQETVAQATRLSVLGEVDRQKAFEATISLQSAFKMSNDQLAESVNFLNAVENQSVTSLQDMTDAIPKVAPVIRGLGGDVKDMAVFLTAMKEGGVDAAEAANGLKSALASMINPSKAAKEMLSGVGIDLQEITNRNKGNLMRTVLDLGNALKSLEPLARTRILEKLFGKYQFARVSALFDNITRSGSQAQRTMELMQMSAIDLAQIANRELTSIEENAGVKFKASIESLKTAIAPIGEVFVKTITPVIEFITKIADKFNGLSDHTKKVIAVIITVIGGIAPVVLMLIGLFANFFGQMMKFFSLIKNGYSSLTGGSKVLGEQTQYLTNAQMEAAAVAASLDQVHAKLTQRFTSEATAVAALRSAYLSAAAASEAFALSNPNMMLPGFRNPRKKFADGVVMVPGSGSGDIVPAMLEPGESVIPKAMTKKYAGLINAMIAGNIPGYQLGKGFKNATVYLPESMNTKMGQVGGTGVPLGDVTGYLKGAGNAAMAPLMAVMAREMKLGLNNPKFKGEWANIGKELSTTVVSALERSGQTMITDDTFETYVVPALREKAKALQVAGKEVGTAMNNAIDQIRTVGPVGVGSGRAGVAGRVALPGSYRNVRTAAQTFAAEQNPEYFQQTTRFSQSRQKIMNTFQTFDPQMKKWEVATMAHITKSITATAEELISKTSSYLGNVGAKITKAITKSTVAGIAAETKTQSPSKETRKVGKDIGKGAVLGIKDEVKNARVAGQAVGVAVVSGAAAAGGAAGGAGGGGVFLGMPGFGPPPEPAQPGRFAKAMGRLRGMSPGGVMMGVSGAVLGASMMPGEVGQFAQKLIPATMALQTVAMLKEPFMQLMKIPGAPIVAALAAAVIGLKLFNNAAEKGARSLENAINRQVEATVGSADAIKGFGKFVGTPPPSQREFSRNNKRIITADEAKTLTYTNYYGSKDGSASNQILTQAASKGSAVGAAALDIAQRAAIYGLSPQDIAANIRAAAKLTGADEFKIKTQIEQMLFNGKDLTKEPLTIEARMNFLNSQTKKSLDSLKTDISKIGKIAMPKSEGSFFGNLFTPEKLRGTMSYQSLRTAAGAQESINKSYSGGFGSESLGALKQTARFLKGYFSDSAYYAGNAIKEFNSIQTDVAIASTKVKMAFTNEIEYLGILNAQYDDGKITQEQYNAAFAESTNRLNAITTAQKDLIAQLDQLDKSGKAADAAIDDLVTNSLSALEKSNPKLFKQIKADIMSLPKEARVEVAMGYASGSLTVIDILQLKKAFDLIASGKNLNYVIDVMIKDNAADQVIATLRKIALEAEKAKLAGVFGPDAAKRLYEINKELKVQEGIIAKARMITPTPKEKNGTVSGGDSGAGTGTKTQGSFLDAIVKQMRDADFMNQKLTQGFKDSKAALLNMFKNPGDGIGLEEWLKSQGAGEPLINLILGMSPEEWTQAKDTLFNFDPVTKKLTGLKEFAKTLGLNLGKMLFDKMIEANDKTIEGIQNQQTVIKQLQSTGMRYGDALEYVANLSPEVLAQLAKTSPADEAWKKLKASIDAVNAALAATPEGQYKAINKITSKAIGMIDQQANVIRAQANVGEFVNPKTGDKINLTADREAVKLAQDKVDAANKLIAGQQSLINGNNQLIDQAQHDLDIIDQKINKKQDEIAAQEAIAKIKFDDPLAKLSDESNMLSNAMSQIEHQAKAINEQYDAQAKALAQVNKLNEQAIQQGKQRISIADALSQGDISTAAQAVQDLRAQEAAANATNMQDMLDAARQQAIDNITAGGMTKAQIEERTYQIQQESFKLEQDRAKFIKENIDPLKAEIADLEKSKVPIQERINKLQSDNYNTQQNIVNIQNTQLKNAQDELDKAQDKLDTDEAIVEEAIKQLTYAGKTKDEWILIEEKAKLALLVLQDVASESEAAAAAAQSLADTFNELAANPPTFSSYEDHYITNYITNVVTTVGGGGSGGSGGGGDTTMQMTTFGGFIKKYANGGSVVPGQGLLDKIPALLTPGEFVVNKASAQAYQPLLTALNSQIYPAMNLNRKMQKTASRPSVNMNTPDLQAMTTSNIGPIMSNINTTKNETATDNSSAVYNYNVDINVNGNNMDADAVANTVLVKIKQLQDQQVRRRLQS